MYSGMELMRQEKSGSGFHKAGIIHMGSNLNFRQLFQFIFGSVNYSV